MNASNPELTLEKLQLIATAKASSNFKIKWLEYFNSSPSTREARRLPPKSVNEDKLGIFLAKACWWAGVSIKSQISSSFMTNFIIFILHYLIVGNTNLFSLNSLLVLSNESELRVFHYLLAQIAEQAMEVFDAVMKQDRIRIDMEAPLEPMTLPAFIEDCRIKLWDHAFNSYFRGHDYFKKNDEFVGYKGADLVVRRAIFRY